MAFTPRTSLTYDTAPACYKSSDYSFVGSQYDMWKINGNCTHYAYARSCEIKGGRVNNDLMDFFPDAGLWLKNSKWKTGSEPKLGAIAVFENHVAIVEKIYKDGRIMLSQSSYKTFIFNTVIKKLTVGTKLDNVAGKLLGYIYNPYVEEDTEETTEPEPVETEITTEQAITKMAKDVIAGKYGNGAYIRKDNLYKVIQTKVNELMRG